MMQEDSNGDFEIVDKKMAGLLTPEAQASGGASSVLANVAPPASLPSFIASPLPAVTSPLPSVASPLPPAPAPHPPAPSAPAPAPAPAVCPPMPPSSQVPVRPPSVIGAAPLQPPPTSMAPTGPPPVSMPSLPSGPSPIPSPVPTTQVPPAPSTSMPPPQATASGTVPPPKGPSLAPVTSQPQLSTAPTVDASVELGKSRSQAGSGNPSWFGWIRGTVSSVSHKVAEKAKNSMDSMITTLDPQMKEYICVLPPDSGGDVDLVVASDKEVKVGAVREAFQAVFGKATVSGIASEAASVAAQPVGFASALTAGEERINSLRGGGKVHPQQPVVAVENFIVELTPGFWYDMGLLLLDDPGQDILLQTYTQFLLMQVTPIPVEYVTQARASTPEDYHLKDSGFATTIGQVASQAMQVHHSQWQETLCGVSRREMVTLAARTLASLYKAQLPQSF